MSGFKNFILRGNLVEIAVGLIMALSFAAVVTSFTAWLTSLLPDSTDRRLLGRHVLRRLPELRRLVRADGRRRLLLRRRALHQGQGAFFPSEPEGTPADIALLEEIRDALKARG